MATTGEYQYDRERFRVQFGMSSRNNDRRWRRVVKTIHSLTAQKEVPVNGPLGFKVARFALSKFQQQAKQNSVRRKRR
jgi:hypothetical protein